MPIVWTEDRQWKPMPSSPYTLERLRMVHGAKILAKTLLGFTRILEIFWVRRRFSRHNKRIKLRVYNRSVFRRRMDSLHDTVSSTLPSGSSYRWWVGASVQILYIEVIQWKGTIWHIVQWILPSSLWISIDSVRFHWILLTQKFWVPFDHIGQKFGRILAGSRG